MYYILSLEVYIMVHGTKYQVFMQQHFLLLPLRSTAGIPIALYE